MNEALNISEKYFLTPENKTSVLQNIGQEREKKGNAEFLIPQIDELQRQAEKMGDFTTMTILFQEKLLCAQHLVMENLKKNPIKIAKGLLILRSTTDQMIKLQNKHINEIDPIVNARSFRFLGRQADIFHQYNQSEKHYRKGLDFFEPLKRVDQRYQKLELSGFLAFSLLKQNKPTWFDLTQKTLSDFDNSPEGIWLKNSDYYTWAVWKSGIEIRNSDALLNSSKLREDYRGNIETWLDNADLILQMPNSDRKIFGIRRQEFDAVTQKLN